MKKFFIGLFVTIALCCSAAAFSACSNGDGGEVPPQFVAYGEDIDYRFSITSEEECPAGNITDDKLHSALSLQNGKTYYLVLDVTFKNFNWAGDRFQIKTTISDKTSLRATLQEAATGDFEEEEDEYSYMVYTRYNVPTDRETERTYRISYDVNMLSDTYVVEAYFEVDDLGLSGSFTVSNAFTYTAGAEAGTCAIRPAEGLQINSLYVPAYLDGLCVTSIADRAFYDSPFGSVHFSENCRLTSIGEEAFMDCTALSSMNIPDSVISVGRSAFYQCASSLKQTENGYQYVDNWLVGYEVGYQWGRSSLREGTKGVADYALERGASHSLNPVSIGELTIPDSVAIIGDHAFDGAYLSGINFGSDSQLTTIGEYAFYESRGLKSITIPYNVSYIGAHAVEKCGQDCVLKFENKEGWKGAVKYEFFEDEQYAGSLIDITIGDETRWDFNVVWELDVVNGIRLNTLYLRRFDV